MPATQRKCILWGLALHVDRHYLGSITAKTHQEKGIITLELNPSRGTVLPALHGKGNKCDKNVKYKRTNAHVYWKIWTYLQFLKIFHEMNCRCREITYKSAIYSYDLDVLKSHSFCIPGTRRRSFEALPCVVCGRQGWCYLKLRWSSKLIYFPS